MTEATVNCNWSDSEFGAPFTGGVLRHEGMEMYYQLQQVPLYCGAYFLCDFLYNGELQSLSSRMQEVYPVSDKEKKKFREFWQRAKLLFGLHALRLRGTHFDWYRFNSPWDREVGERAMSMQMTFWEISRRPMYYGGMVMSGRRPRPVTNPNSGNLARFYSFPIGEQEYERLHRKWGHNWVRFVRHEVSYYPDNLEDPDGYVSEDDYEEEW